MACGGGKKPSPNRSQNFVESQVSHFSENEVNHVYENAQYQFLKSQDEDFKSRSIKNQVLEDCKGAAIESGLRVLNDQSEISKDQNIFQITIGEVIEKKPKKSSTLGCFFEESKGRNNCFDSDFETITKEINLEIFSDNQIKVHEIVVESTGFTNSVTKVARQMCQAAFKDFPTPMIKKKYLIPYASE